MPRMRHMPDPKIPPLFSAPAAVACFPLEVLRTRLACAPHAAASTAAGSAAAGAAAAARPAAAAAPGLASAALALIREGPTALFAGLAPSLLGVIPYAGINLGAYDGLRLAAAAALGLASPAALPKSAALVIGAVAGVTASTATFPLEVVRRRMMLGACPQFGGNTWKALVRSSVGLFLFLGLGGVVVAVGWIEVGAPCGGTRERAREKRRRLVGVSACFFPPLTRCFFVPSLSFSFSLSPFRQVGIARAEGFGALFRGCLLNWGASARARARRT